MGYFADFITGCDIDKVKGREAKVDYRYFASTKSQRNTPMRSVGGWVFVVDVTRGEAERGLVKGEGGKRIIKQLSPNPKLYLIIGSGELRHAEYISGLRHRVRHRIEHSIAFVSHIRPRCT